jgi:hypothetical protein
MKLSPATSSPRLVEPKPGQTWPLVVKYSIVIPPYSFKRVAVNWNAAEHIKPTYDQYELESTQLFSRHGQPIAVKFHHTVVNDTITLTGRDRFSVLFENQSDTPFVALANKEVGTIRYSDTQDEHLDVNNHLKFDRLCLSTTKLEREYRPAVVLPPRTSSAPIVYDINQALSPSDQLLIQNVLQHYQVVFAKRNLDGPPIAHDVTHAIRVRADCPPVK